jgi:hypothetical protein
MCVAFAFCNLPLLALLFSLPVSCTSCTVLAHSTSCLPFNPPPTLRGSTFEGAGQEQEVVEELAARLGHTKVYKGKEDELRIGKRVLEIKHGLVYSACESTLALLSPCGVPQLEAHHLTSDGPRRSMVWRVAWDCDLTTAVQSCTCLQPSVGQICSAHTHRIGITITECAVVPTPTPSLAGSTSNNRLPPIQLLSGPSRRQCLASCHAEHAQSHTHTHTHARTITHTHTRTHAQSHTHTHTHTQSHTQTHTHTITHTRTDMNTQTNNRFASV